jgi:hypothetical protein
VKIQNEDLQLGFLECKAHHNVKMDTLSQIDFDNLRQPHMLNKPEKYTRISLE